MSQIPPLMIGMMKCALNGTACGSIKEASITSKPSYREHKTGASQITDVKVVSYVESVCKVETDEWHILDLVKDTAIGIVSSRPKEIAFSGVAPGVGGGGFLIEGTGFGSASTLSGKAADFGSLAIDTTCLSLNLAANDTSTPLDLSPPICGVQTASQALTLDCEALLFGAPYINGNECLQAQFSSNCKVRYYALSWPPTIDAAIMESSDTAISCTVISSASPLVEAAIGNMTPGTSLPNITASLQIPTIGGDSCRVTMDGAVEPDLSFNPGNDWNGVSIKITALLSDPKLIGTNWANIS